MYYFIYKTTLINSDKFYIGRHKSSIVEDNYFGSGKWIRSIKDRTLLRREILEFAETDSEIRHLEEKYIANHIDDINCMNFVNSSVGFGSGEYHYSAKMDNYSEIMSERTSGSKNGMYGKKLTPAQIEQKRINSTGRTHTEATKQKIGKANKISKKGVKLSEDHKQKMSETHLNRHKNGERNLPLYAEGEHPWIGRKHSEDQKAKMRGPRGKWANNGIETRMFKDEIPEGWVSGRIKWK